MPSNADVAVAPVTRRCGVAIGRVERDTRRAADSAALDPVVTERIGELLRAHGLRRMPLRIAVLGVLEPVAGHLSVAEIHQRIVAAAPPGAPPPDLATIYRTVTTLDDRGVLHPLTLDGGLTTYGLAVDPHHHAVCTRYGTIIEVPAQRLASALELASAGSAFSLSERAGLTLHGLCPQCQTTARDRTPGRELGARPACGGT